MKPLTFAGRIACFAALLLAGCQNPRTARIQEHAAAFAALDPVSQQIIRDGLFNPGFTPEQMYMSLGKPNRRTVVETDDGTLETWVYRNFVYGNIGAVRFGANNPGTRYAGPVLSSSAPGGPSLHSTKAGSVQPTLSDGSDAPVGTLNVQFLNGRVVAARVDP